MSIFHESDYLRLLKSTPQEACVEKSVLICRSLIGGISDDSCELPQIFAREHGVTDDMLDLRGAMLGSAQGIRTHAAMMRVHLPQEGSLHIVDWNAAQGFHTMALLEVLIARGELRRLNRITLIHPCDAALERGRRAAVLMTDGLKVTVEKFPRFFPGREGQPPLGLQYDGDIVLHLLPDCLHRPDIDLPLLAYLMSTPGHRHIAVSINPLTGGDHAPALRKLLPGSKLIADIASPHFTYTEDFSPVSCRALVWEYRPSRRLKLPKKDIYTRGRKPQENFDRNLPARLARASLPDSLRSLLYDISLSAQPCDKLLLKPTLPPYGADLAVIRPDRGMMLAAVVAEADSQPEFMERVEAAVENLRDMRRMLALHLPGMDGRKAVREAIRLTVIAASIPTESLPEMALPGNAQLVGADVLHTAGGADRLARCLPMKGNFRFPKACAETALRLLAPRWKWAVKGRPLTPDSAQQKVLKARNPEWVTGAASSGKTTLLLLRALQSYYATGEPVLIVLPHASALCATRAMASGLFADYPSDALHIVALSDLRRSGKVVESPRRGKFAYRFLPRFLMAAEASADYGQSLPEPRLYHTILVDDAHLLTERELEILRGTRLHPSGRITCFANPLEARNLLIPRRAMRLTETHSPLAGEMGSFLRRIISHLDPNVKTEGTPPTPGCVLNLAATSSAPTHLAKSIRDLMAEHSLWPHATLVTVDSEALLREIHSAFCEQPSIACMTGFTPASLLEEFGRTTRNPRGADSLHKDSLLHRFNPGDERLKLATPDCLIGTRFPNVIYLYRHTAHPDYRTIYRVVTRATSRLIILSYT